MNYIYLVITKENSDIGLEAIAIRTAEGNNLIGYGRDLSIKSLNVFPTWKMAKETAADWNNCYIKNGSQIGGKIDHVMITENQETNKTVCHIYYANGTKQKNENFIPFNARDFMRWYEVPTDMVEFKERKFTIKMYGANLKRVEK